MSNTLFRKICSQYLACRCGVSIVNFGVFEGGVPLVEFLNCDLWGEGKMRHRIANNLRLLAGSTRRKERNSDNDRGDFSRRNNRPYLLGKFLHRRMT